MIRAALVAICALALLAGGCGGDDSKKSSASSSKERAMKAKEEKAAMKAKEEKAMKGEGTTLKVVSSQYGSVVADGRGQAFYLFAKEKSNRSECYGTCAKTWPPVLTKGTPSPGRSARRGLLGTTKRQGGGLQVTYAGHPMYYFNGDSPGQIKCQNVSEFGGAWLVVKPNGKPVS